MEIEDRLRGIEFRVKEIEEKNFRNKDEEEKLQKLKKEKEDLENELESL